MISLSCVGYKTKGLLCKVLLHGASRGAGGTGFASDGHTNARRCAFSERFRRHSSLRPLASSSKFASLCARLIPPATRSCTYGSSSAWAKQILPIGS